MASLERSCMGATIPRKQDGLCARRSTGITVTGVSNAEERRAKPLTDVGCRQCCYHQIKSPMYKINPLRIAKRFYLQHFCLLSLKSIVLLFLFY